jgi:DNA sulfur modification protein DndD
MEISAVVLKNFKQYYDAVPFDFRVSNEKNLVIVGGKNGHGKTNFLVGLVWCLYGNNISQVDEIFKREVKGGYSKFLSKALNWSAKDDGINSFSVSITFDNVELSDGFFISFSVSKAQVIISREYDTLSGSETLKIFIDGIELELLKDEEDKLTFINDYIIPIQAAKFVFFDAEKIADIAELNLSEQGRIMNDALGKLLGLDVYENLVDDLETYRKQLKKESATKDTFDQIESFENKRSLNVERVNEIDGRKDSTDEQIFIFKREIAEIEKFLSDHGSTTSTVDLASLYHQKKSLEEKKSEISSNLFDQLEIIPFCIFAGKMQELVAQLELEELRKNARYEHDDFIEKSNALIEKLFNKPPLPEDDISLKQKSFYFNKANNLIKEIFLNHDEKEEPPFEHDLSGADISHINRVFDMLKLSNDERLDNLNKELVRVENDLTRANNAIRKAEGLVLDDEIENFKREKEQLESKIREFEREIGSIESERIRLAQENQQLDKRIENLLNKVNISKEKKKTLDSISQYINTLHDFIESEKKEKHKKIESKILNELNQLMHKKLVSNVKVRIIPDNKGLEVLLFKHDGKEILKDDLSKGEQQLYVSCLLKAILNESISDMPVFIDTPLGRLDKEHKENILDNYYPTLAHQVIIFSTNDEITPQRYQGIESIVNRAYVLNNVNGNTDILQGYFNN